VPRLGNGIVSTAKRVGTRTIFVLPILLLTAVAAGTLRVALIAGKRTINHDEAISYLCAAGKQGLYRSLASAEQPPFGVWVPAAEIKQFLQPEKRFCLRQISRDLADTDIHPPLYFWLLHLWCLALGVDLWTGPALNILIAVATVPLLFGLARFVLRDDLAAAGVAATWALSPAAIETCFEARHYDLLALVTVGFAWALLRCASPGRPLGARHLILLGLMTAAGTLTHYHFPLIVVAGAGLAGVRASRPRAGCPHSPGSTGGQLVFRRPLCERRRLALICASIAVGGALFLAVHPRFWQSLLQAREQTQPFELSAVVPRLESTVLCYSTFFVSTRHNAWIVHKYLPLVAAGLILGVIASCPRARRPHSPGAGIPARGRDARTPLERASQPDAGDEGARPAVMLYFLLAMAVSNAGLYVVGLSPKHAMGAMYLAMVWPFLAFLPVVVLRELGRLRVPLLLLWCCGMAASGGISVDRLMSRWRALPDPGPVLQAAPAVLVDNLARGVLPCVAWHVPDDRLMLAGSQTYLLNHRDAWLSRMQAGGVYVSEESYGNSEAARAQLRRLLSRQTRLRPVTKGIFGLGQVDVVEPAPAVWFRMARLRPA
jgi:hypothetical protein